MASWMDSFINRMAGPKPPGGLPVQGRPGYGGEGGFNRRDDGSVPYEDLDQWLKDFLEGEGVGMRANYMSRGNSRNANESDWQQNSYQDWFDKYLARLGGTARSNQDPNLSFTDFLDQDYDYDRELNRAPVERTGRQVSRLAGPARYLYNF